jgi:hypothetical protein
MKRYYAAAGALLLGTSTLAWAGDADKSMVEPVEVTHEARTGMDWDKSAWTDKSAFATASDAKLEMAALDKDLEKFATDDSDAKLQTVSADDLSDAKLQTAALGSWSDDKVDAASKVDTAWTDSEAKVETAAFDKADAAMGGPVEQGGNVTTAELTPRPTADNYPPCAPGPGDDRCIQLYEPGVRTALASWNRPTGGLADHQATTAMGGPYEPVVADTTDSMELAMNGDGVVDASVGETGDGELQTVAVEPEPAVAGHADYQGVGGPVEAQSGYPPCSPGPGDDRCIQLYESGVTGVGN